MLDILSEPSLRRAVLAGLGVALAAGPVGCFIVWRRMAHLSGTLAHSGLFGVGLGLMFGFSLTLGAMATALAAALLLLGLKARRLLATDTLLGILSYASLALGLITVGRVSSASADRMDLLFGDALAITARDVTTIWVGAAAVFAVLAFLWRDLIAVSVHEELARAEGVQVKRAEIGFILLIALMTAMSIKIVGLLLITALMVIPAAAARRLSSTPERMALVSALMAGLAVVGGLLLSASTNAISGPSVVLAAGLLFILTLALPQIN